MGSQIAIFIALIFIKFPWVFGALVCYVLLCYGGGFGAMPAFVLDVFGPVRIPVVYGAILLAVGFLFSLALSDKPFALKALAQDKISG